MYQKLSEFCLSFVNIQRYPNGFQSGSKAVPTSLNWYGVISILLFSDGVVSVFLCSDGVVSVLLLSYLTKSSFETSNLVPGTRSYFIPSCFQIYITVFFRTQKMDWRKLDMPLVQINPWSIVLHPQMIQMEGWTQMTEALQLLVNFILLISCLFVHAQN